MRMKARWIDVSKLVVVRRKDGTYYTKVKA
ncbi:hypothetical protein U7154_000058 [Kononvirus KKP3711]|uniref:Uncharacterized protein n=1 Tax=Enterobacter phage KKP_3711 TaxID=3109398 RepID=A0AAX4Q3Y8_9CAUD